MTESAQSRTVPPSPRRLREARERGDAPRSPLAVGAALWLGFVATASLIGGAALERLRAMAHASLTQLERDPSEALTSVADEAAPLIALPAAAAMLVAALLSALIARPSPSLRALRVDFGRLDPAAGLARLFGGRALVERLGPLVLIAALGAVAVGATLEALRTSLGALGRTPDQVAAVASEALLTFGWRTAAVLSLGGGVAAVYRLWRWWKDQHMTPREAREERRRAEGDEMARHRRRQLARSRAKTAGRAEAMQRAALIVRGGRMDVALSWADREAAPRVEWVGARGPLPSGDGAANWVVDPRLAEALALVGAGRAVPRRLWPALAQHMRDAGLGAAA